MVMDCEGSTHCCSLCSFSSFHSCFVVPFCSFGSVHAFIPLHYNRTKENKGTNKTHEPLTFLSLWTRNSSEWKQNKEPKVKRGQVKWNECAPLFSLALWSLFIRSFRSFPFPFAQFNSRLHFFSLQLNWSERRERGKRGVRSEWRENETQRKNTRKRVVFLFVFHSSLHSPVVGRCVTGVVGLFCVHSFRFITSGRKWAREWSESEHSTNHPTNNEVKQKNKFKWNKSAHFTCLLFILNLVFCFSSYSSCLLVVCCV